MEKLIDIFKYVEKNNPLIHCVTNHININDTANIILAGHGQPIMAEHPEEVYDITKGANSLMINFGNINSERYESSLIAYKSAIENKKEILIDLVGCSCSSLRRKLYKSMLIMGAPSIIKGNMSEILSIYEDKTITKGVDSLKSHKLEIDQIEKLAIKHSTTIIVTGKEDIITDGKSTYLCKNGHHLMSRRTGTGCTGSALTAMYLSSGDVLYSAILGTLIMGIIGQRAFKNIDGKQVRLGYLFNEMLNELYNLKIEDIISDMRLYKL